jgi:archaetidylinositol phosphate synthase
MQEESKSHVREYGGLLEKPEKMALLWLARRTPAWINSDHLTVIGLASMLTAGLAYWTAGRHPLALIVVVISLAVNWLGDSLDGTIARFRNCQRPKYGYYVDHVIDLLGVSALMAGLACSGYMNPLIAVSLLATFAMVEAEVFLATYVQRVFRLSCFRIGPTELRIVLAIGTMYLLHNPWVHIGQRQLRLFDVGGIVSVAGLMCALIYSSLRNTRALYLEEPISCDDASSDPSNRVSIQIRRTALESHPHMKTIL